eukprot:9200-Heterococcus_DN1.PRE.1
MRELEKQLVALGMSVSAVKDLKRWDRVHMISVMANLAVTSNTQDADSVKQFTRKVRKSHAGEKKMYRQSIQEIWDRQMQALKANEADAREYSEFRPKKSSSGNGANDDDDLEEDDLFDDTIDTVNATTTADGTVVSSTTTAPTEKKSMAEIMRKAPTTYTEVADRDEESCCTRRCCALRGEHSTHLTVLYHVCKLTGKLSDSTLKLLKAGDLNADSRERHALKEMRRQLASEKESVTPTSATTTTIGVDGAAVKTVTPVAAAQPLTSTSAYMRDMEQLVEFLRSTGIEVPPRLVKVIERVINPDGSETVNISTQCVQTALQQHDNLIYIAHHNYIPPTTSPQLHPLPHYDSYDLSKESLVRLDPANKRTKQQPQHQQQQAEIEEIALKKYPLKSVLPEADYTKGADNIFIREDESGTKTLLNFGALRQKVALHHNEKKRKLAQDREDEADVYKVPRTKTSQSRSRGGHRHQSPMHNFAN